MIRSNPGLMLLKKGVVIRKWSVNDFPDEYMLTGPLDTLPIGSLDLHSFVRRTVWVVAWFVFPLFFICIVDLSWERYRRRKLKKK